MSIELKVFLRLAYLFTRFIKRSAMTAKPLIELTGKNVSFLCGTE